MSNITNVIANWLDGHPSIKQWGWFTLLWLGGLLTALTLSYPLKLFIKLAAS